MPLFELEWFSIICLGIQVSMVSNEIVKLDMRPIDMHYPYTNSIFRAANSVRCTILKEGRI